MFYNEETTQQHLIDNLIHYRGQLLVIMHMHVKTHDMYDYIFNTSEIPVHIRKLAINVFSACSYKPRLLINDEVLEFFDYINNIRPISYQMVCFIVMDKDRVIE